MGLECAEKSVRLPEQGAGLLGENLSATRGANDADQCDNYSSHWYHNGLSENLILWLPGVAGIIRLYEDMDTDSADVCTYTENHHPSKMRAFGLLSHGTDILEKSATPIGFSREPDKGDEDGRDD